MNLLVMYHLLFAVVWDLCNSIERIINKFTFQFSSFEKKEKNKSPFVLFLTSPFLFIILTSFQ